MASPVVTCPSCNRRTPRRHPRCVYCSQPLAHEPAPAAEPAHHEPRMLGGKPRFTRRSDDRTHYLISELADPVSLEPGQLFVMGRDPHTSLVLRAPDVSRQHAEIDWEGDPPRPLICEVRSSQGTFLNDKPVLRGSPQPIRSGDRIRLGTSVTLTYLHVTERALQKELEERAHRETRYFDSERLRASLEEPPDPPLPDTAVQQPRLPAPPERLNQVVSAILGEDPAPPRAPEPAPSSAEGRFLDVAPSALLRQLNQEQRSGVLTFFVEGVAPGELVLVEGRCKDALVGIYTGREAVEVLGGVEDGLFRFRDQDPDDLRSAPAAADMDEEGYALSGYLDPDFTGAALLEDLASRLASGVLTVCDGAVTGEVTLDRGACRLSLLEREQGSQALDGIRAMREGAYRFRPDAPSLETPPTQPMEPDHSRPMQRRQWRAVDPPARRRPPPSGSGRVRPSGSGRVPPGRRPTRRPPPRTARRRRPTRGGPRRPSSPLRPPSDEEQLPPGSSPLK